MKFLFHCPNFEFSSEMDIQLPKNTKQNTVKKYCACHVNHKPSELDGAVGNRTLTFKSLSVAKVSRTDYLPNLEGLLSLCMQDIFKGFPVLCLLRVVFLFLITILDNLESNRHRNCIFSFP